MPSADPPKTFRPSSPPSHDSSSSSPRRPQQFNTQISSEDFFPTPQTMLGKIFADFYQWPVFFAVLPPLLSLVYGGKVEEWSEIFMLLVIAFYLYGLVKVPWELYDAARVDHHQISKLARAYANGDLDLNSEAEAIRQSSVWKLWILEWLYFLLVLASPLGGAVFLRYIRPHLHLYQNLINNFPMALYVLTAYIRPLIHLTRLFKQQTKSFQQDIHYPNLEVNVLKKKVSKLEKRLEELFLLVDETRNETVRELKNSVEPSMKVLNKDIRKSSRRELKFIDYSISRFRELELRLQEQEFFISRNKLNLERRQTILFAPAYWIIDSVADFSVGSLLMLPLNVAVKVATWCVPAPIKRVVANKIGVQKRPSITDGTDAQNFNPKLNNCYSPSPSLYPWDPATRVPPSDTSDAPLYHHNGYHDVDYKTHKNNPDAISPLNLSRQITPQFTHSPTKKMASPILKHNVSEGDHFHDSTTSPVLQDS